MKNLNLSLLVVFVVGLTVNAVAKETLKKNNSTTETNAATTITTDKNTAVTPLADADQLKAQDEKTKKATRNEMRGSNLNNRL